MRDGATVIVTGGPMVDEECQRADKERRGCSFVCVLQT